MPPHHFRDYPLPKKAPDAPHTYNRKSNPALRGWLVAISAWLLDWFWFLPEPIWRNAGFASLRDIGSHLDTLEPRYDPTVIPLHESPAPVSYGDVRSNPPTKINPATKYYSVADYHALYKSGEVTPTDVAKALLPLIRRDLPSPGKHSVAWFESRVDDILTAAEESTRRYREKCPRGIFDGVPTAVKAEFDVDGYTTNLGSLNDYTPKPSSGEDPSITNWCVRQLEEAGALMLGKLSMHEFGLDTTGVNIHYGTPTNPYHSRYYTGGSSSGCAYAVGSGLIPIALGTDGGGSVRIPASFCSVFGLKPTHNRLSHYPGVNYASTTSVIGPLASDIRSLAAAYHLVAKPGPDTVFPAPKPLDLSPPTPRSKVLGIPEVWFSRAAPEVQRLCRSMLDQLVRVHGYTLVPIDIPFPVEGQTAHAMTILTDAAAVLTDTTNITAANRILLTLGRTTPATDYLRAQKLRRLLMDHLAALWQEHPGMIIVTPTTACAGWCIQSPSDLRYGFSDGDQTIKAMEYVWLANFTGIPALSVPAGYVDPEIPDPSNHPGRVPVGLMAHGEWGTEEELLQWGVVAEEVGAELRERPPIWEDAVELAREYQREGTSIASH